MNVEFDPHGPPIVRIIAAMIRRSLVDDAVAKRATKAKGTVAFRSAGDPQAVTMRFNKGTVLIEAGADPDADVTITADLNDDSVKPKVAGAATSPGLAMAVGKLLEPPTGTWQEEGDNFWPKALEAPDFPRPVKVVCTDDGASRQWGGEGEPEIEIHGPATTLAAGMSGSDVMAAAMLEGRLRVVGDLRALALVMRPNVDHLLGEL